MSERLGALYHWSPVERRKAIFRYGLRPNQRVTVTTDDGEFRQPHVCLSPTPFMAWGLSGGMSWMTHVADWDLWQVSLEADAEVHVRPFWGTTIEEVQVRSRIPKSCLWHVGTRTR